MSTNTLKTSIVDEHSLWEKPSHVSFESSEKNKIIKRILILIAQKFNGDIKRILNNREMNFEEFYSAVSCDNSRLALTLSALKKDIIDHSRGDLLSLFEGYNNHEINQEISEIVYCVTVLLDDKDSFLSTLSRWEEGDESDFLDIYDLIRSLMSKNSV